MIHYIKPTTLGTLVGTSPASAGWKYLGFKVVKLRAGESSKISTEGMMLGGCR
jgi:5-deoxy-D-glucuronate isomerase